MPCFGAFCAITSSLWSPTISADLREFMSIIADSSRSDHSVCRGSNRGPMPRAFSASDFVRQTIPASPVFGAGQTSALSLFI